MQRSLSASMKASTISEAARKPTPFNKRGPTSILSPYTWQSQSPKPDFQWSRNAEQTNAFLSQKLALHPEEKHLVCYVDWETNKHTPRDRAAIIGLAGVDWISVTRVLEMSALPTQLKKILWSHSHMKWVANLEYAEALHEDFGMPQSTIAAWSDLVREGAQRFLPLPAKWESYTPPRSLRHGYLSDISALIAYLEKKELALLPQNVHRWSLRSEWDMDINYVANILSASQCILQHFRPSLEVQKMRQDSSWISKLPLPFVF